MKSIELAEEQESAIKPIYESYKRIAKEWGRQFRIFGGANPHTRWELSQVRKELFDKIESFSLEYDDVQWFFESKK